MRAAGLLLVLALGCGETKGGLILQLGGAGGMFGLPDGAIWTDLVPDDDGDVCTIDGLGSSTIIDPSDGDACTVDWCDPAIGVQNVGDEMVFEETFADDSFGWTLEGDWQIGQALASSDQTWGNGDPGADHTPSLDEGLAGTIIGGATTSSMSFMRLVSPPLGVPPAPPGAYTQLRFWRWANLPPGRRAAVLVGEELQTIVWESDEAGVEDAEWHEVTLDLTPVWTVSSRLIFAVIQDGAGAPIASGFSVDDVELHWIPYEDDGDACTAAGLCMYPESTQQIPIDPDDFDACTVDVCLATNGVSHLPLDPDDGDPCTLDACDPVYGVTNEPIPGCVP